MMKWLLILVMAAVMAFLSWENNNLTKDYVQQQSIMIAMANRNQQLESVMAEVIPAFEETYGALLQCRQAAGSQNRALYSL
jgi:ABC-type glycerol-3-phosphate transport system substrate-binding protein